MTIKYAKSIRKKLRELAGLAHGRELSSAMETLDRHFAQYRRQGGLEFVIPLKRNSEVVLERTNRNRSKNKFSGKRIARSRRK
jgi:hypothetical protein